MHCDNAPCMAACPTKGALYKRKDGMVIIDSVKCTGCRKCVDACPYQAIYFNEDMYLAQKCTGCAHLLDKGWKEPRCVEFCPTNALIFGDLDDPNSEISQRLATEKAEPLRSEFGMKEKVLYLNMPKRFIAGSVVFGDTDKCAGNVTVSLIDEGEHKTTKTNNYGDFEFEGLTDNRDYTVQIKHRGYKLKELTVRTKIDIYLGDIVLSKPAR